MEGIKIDDRELDIRLRKIEEGIEEILEFFTKSELKEDDSKIETKEETE